MGYQKIAVGALIVQDDKILIQYHNKLQKLSIPMGKVEIGETPQEAIVRELKEELGVTKFTIKGVWAQYNDNLGVTERIFNIELNSDWFNAEPAKHEWMEFKSVDWIMESKLGFSDLLKNTLELIKEDPEWIN